jgi:hypothetical protein
MSFTYLNVFNSFIFQIIINIRHVLTIVKMMFGGNQMKRIKTILVVILMVLSILTIGIAAEATFLKKVEVNHQKQTKNVGQPMLFDAEITFYVLTGEGCACTPIVGATISAVGGEGSDSGVTDEDGMCVLTLVILGEYEVFIEAEDYHRIYFEFNVLDDQTFTFHLLERKGTSLNSLPSLYHLVKNIFER